MTFKEKEQNFDKIIGHFAALQNKFFIGDSGEGRDFETDTVYAEDVAGWLVPQDLKELIISYKAKNDVPSEFYEYYCFAIWNYENGEFTIDFVKYDF